MRIPGALLMLGGILWATPALGQMAGANEIQLLQEASQQESLGELESAERLLRLALEERSESVPALLSLERVLRIQRRLDELPPLVETALEGDPRSALLNQLLIRSYSQLDRVDALESAGERWIAATPRIEIPYRELAAVWQERGEYGKAREVLEEGRRQIGVKDALALDLADLYVVLGEPALAVAEWDRAVDRSGRGLNQVWRRLKALPDEGTALTPDLVDLLAADPTATGRVSAALELAVEAGLEDRARSLAESLLPSLAPGERRHLMDDIARRSDAAGHTALAFWAYDQLLNLEWLREVEEGRFLALRNRLAELALELGDTAVAASRYQDVEEAYGPGSPQRRQAAAARIELLAAQDVDAAAAALAAFRKEFREGQEVDRLAAAVARQLMKIGRLAEAGAVLDEVDGPRSSILRGRLSLGSGDVAAARMAFLSAAPALRGAEATAVLSLATVIGRVSEETGVLIAELLALREQGEVGGAVDRVTAALDELEPGDRPALLDFTAGMAEEAGLTVDARELRRRLVADYPRSNEAPGALLALARDLTADEGREAEARELLERLIIEYPRSTLVPQARRALDRLDGRGVA